MKTASLFGDRAKFYSDGVRYKQHARVPLSVTHTHTHTRARAHTHLHARTHAHMRLYARTHTYTHAYTQAPARAHSHTHARPPIHPHTHASHTHFHYHARRRGDDPNKTRQYFNFYFCDLFFLVMVKNKKIKKKMEAHTWKSYFGKARSLPCSCLSCPPDVKWALARLAESGKLMWDLPGLERVL